MAMAYARRVWAAYSGTIVALAANNERAGRANSLLSLDFSEIQRALNRIFQHKYQLRTNNHSVIDFVIKGGEQENIHCVIRKRRLIAKWLHLLICIIVKTFLNRYFIIYRYGISFSY